MGLGDFFKKIRESFSGREKASVPAPAARKRGGKSLPPLPAYLKKDKFLRESQDETETAGESSQKSEMAEAGSFKRPGKWLRNKLGGSEETKLVDNIEKTKKALKRSAALNDAEIEHFLGSLLEEAPEKEAEQPPASGKRPPPSPGL
ncbi:MAG TPA: hypothetical protein DF383_10700 [Deltaproteobacteria bacterium]|nr:hypothetical protein [Deltaproteobacteria bacterium]